MITSHTYRPDYAGLDPDKQICTHVLATGVNTGPVICGGKRDQHAEFAVPGQSHVTQIGDPHAQTPVSTELPVRETSENETAQHPDRHVGIDDSSSENRSGNPPHDETRAVTDDSIRPAHYRGPEGIPFPCIDVVRDMTFGAGNAVKYLWRTELKNGRQDIEKAQWYLKDAVAHGWSSVMYVGLVPKDWDALLAVVEQAQTDPLRRQFFNAVRHEMADWALAAVDEMLKQ